MLTVSRNVQPAQNVATPSRGVDFMIISELELSIVMTWAVGLTDSCVAVSTNGILFRRPCLYRNSGLHLVGLAGVCLNLM